MRSGCRGPSLRGLLGRDIRSEPAEQHAVGPLDRELPHLRPHRADDDPCGEPAAQLGRGVAHELERADGGPARADAEHEALLRQPLFVDGRGDLVGGSTIDGDHPGREDQARRGPGGGREHRERVGARDVVHPEAVEAGLLDGGGQPTDQLGADRRAHPDRHHSSLSHRPSMHPAPPLGREESRPGIRPPDSGRRKPNLVSAPRLFAYR